MEIRSFDGIGMPEIEQTEAGNRITGYAIVFNSRSERLYDPFTRREFVEIIDANAVGEELLKRSDIKALYNHDRNRLLARSTNGEGTLSLSIDDKGLRYSFTAPNTEYGREVKELIKRGDLRGSSFAFTFDENDVEETRHQANNTHHKAYKWVIRCFCSLRPSVPKYECRIAKPYGGSTHQGGGDERRAESVWQRRHGNGTSY